MHASHDVIQAQQGGWGPPPGGGGGYGPPSGGGGFGGPPPGGFGGPPPGAPYGTPPPGGGFGAPPGGGFGAGPGGPPPPDLQGQLNTWFILSIISIFFGCCLGGLFATYTANQAKQSFAAGNYMDAQSKLGTAKIVAIISFVIGGLGLIGNIAANL